ncbi:MFS transporter [Lactiplantibacillus plantarum]|uniref:MFS transporter n=1 Tax=Lactiplantibacillus plantarum TaxID=1590 RepID=UPI0013D5A5D9|nr:MFS transporter [Lactiplantibacillus plantarum]
MNSKSLNKSTVLLMAISAAIVVANINYIQPIEADIAQQFNLPNAVIGAVAMLTQLGYAFGLLLIVPMGDIMNRRMLIMRLLVLAIISALLAFVAPNIWVYALASLLIGITSVAPQVIIPYAGFLAPRNQRGQVLGNVLSGLLVGVLLSRTVSGVLASYLPWQMVYLIAAILIAGLWLVLWRKLPHDPVTTHTTNYKAMIQTVPQLVKRYPVLRASAVNGFVLFGVSNIFWATLVFYLQHQYGWGSREAGLLALLGVTDLFVEFSAAMKTLAVDLSKFSNDLRLLASGPQAGFGELNLPAQQAGSSIMPGKINPVIPEVVNQVAFEVIGHDTTVTMAAEAGQLELNAFEPIMLRALLASEQHLQQALTTLVDHCVRQLTVNRQRCADQVAHSAITATVLAPYLGYETTTALIKEALTTNQAIPELLHRRRLLSDDLVEQLFSPAGLTQPRPEVIEQLRAVAK